MAYNYGNIYQNPYQQYQNYAYPPNNMMTQLNSQVSMNPQPMPNVPMQQPVQQQTSGTSGFIWVQGEAGAKAYPVAAGNSVLLMDSENPVLYMKSTDASGRPLPMETYDLVKREEAIQRPTVPQSNALPTQQIDLSEYVKMSDLEAKVQELINKALGN